MLFDNCKKLKRLYNTLKNKQSEFFAKARTILKNQGDISLPRNPLITKMFRIIDLAENAGYGFDKMIKGWSSFYNTEPVITSGIDYYKIEFYFKDNAIPRINENEGLNEGLKSLHLFFKENPGKQAKDAEEILKIVNDK